MVSTRYVTVACLFVTCLIMSNILAVKLTEVDGRVLDAGNVVFPISYIIGDVLTEVWGFKAARRVIWIGFACNLLAALAIQAAIHLPSAGFWQDQEAYDQQMAAQQAYAAQQAPAAPAAPDYAAELQQLAALKGQGLITEEEFEAKKKQILGI